MPIILYNVPGRTASNITAETTLRLANEFKNIIAIKEDGIIANPDEAGQKKEERIMEIWKED